MPARLNIKRKVYILPDPDGDKYNIPFRGRYSIPGVQSMFGGRQVIMAPNGGLYIAKEV